jgi:hypothetical protein
MAEFKFDPSLRLNLELHGDTQAAKRLKVAASMIPKSGYRISDKIMLLARNFLECLAMAYGSHQVTALSVRKLSKIAHTRPIAGMGGSGRSGHGDIAGVADARVDLISIPSTTAKASLFDLRLIAKNNVQQGTVGFNVAVVTNKPRSSKFAHEKSHARSRRADHLHQCLLADFRDNWLRPAFFVKIRRRDKA